MHLPDGYLSPPVWAGLDAVAALTLGGCLVRLRREPNPALAPRMGMLGAFVFAAQMINVPVGLGTSGHLLGGVLVASMVGPEAATVVMASVFLIQALLFQDGGVLALGANAVNMGLSGTLGGYALLRLFVRWLPGRRRDLAVFMASWLSVVGSSALVSVELWQSGTVPLMASLAAMVSVHSVIGLVEGGLTVGVVRFVERVEPRLLVGTPLQRAVA